MSLEKKRKIVDMRFSGYLEDDGIPYDCRSMRLYFHMHPRKRVFCSSFIRSFDHVDL